jgi:hypothetical protein
MSDDVFMVNLVDPPILSPAAMRAPMVVNIYIAAALRSQGVKALIFLRTYIHVVHIYVFCPRGSITAAPTAPFHRRERGWWER